MRAARAGWIGGALALSIGCGGPEIIDSDPTQSVQYYFSGTDETGALHVHVDWTQTKHDIVLRSPCVPQDNCDIYAFSETGKAELGLTQVPFIVNLASGSGTFADPGIKFTVTTVNGRTFSFDGTVTTNGNAVQMIGMLSGPTHPASRLVLDRQQQ